MRGGEWKHARGEMGKEMREKVPVGGGGIIRQRRCKRGGRGNSVRFSMLSWGGSADAIGTLSPRAVGVPFCEPCP